MSKLLAITDKIRTEYESAVRSCDWDDDVAEVLKRRIFEISCKLYFDIRREITPVNLTPIESGKVSSQDIANVQNVSSEVDNIISELASIEEYLNSFKI